MNNLSVIISYSSLEQIFIKKLLDECLRFTDDIVVSYGDKLYNGEPEDEDFIENLKMEYPYVTFVKYIVDLDMPIEYRKGVQNRPTSYYHNLARWTAINALKNKEWVFVIDADEIPDGQLVQQWFERYKHSLHPFNAYKFANYWYYKEPTYRAKNIEDSVLLAHYSILSIEDNIFGDFERDHIIGNSGVHVIRQTTLNYVPMWHHFSFVRTKKSLHKKLTSWAHIDDDFKHLNAIDIINHIYRTNQPNDIIKRYDYNIVPNKFNIQIPDDGYDPIEHINKMDINK